MLTGAMHKWIGVFLNHESKKRPVWRKLLIVTLNPIFHNSDCMVWIAYCLWLKWPIPNSHMTLIDLRIETKKWCYFFSQKAEGCMILLFYQVYSNYDHFFLSRRLSEQKGKFFAPWYINIIVLNYFIIHVCSLIYI